MNKFSTGALPPEGMEWQTGKTAASMRVVFAADRLASAPHRRDEAEKLRNAMQKISSDVKEGIVSYESFEAAELLERLYSLMQ